MRILVLMKNELLYGGLSKSEFRQVEEPVSERNRKLLVAWSVAVGLFWIASMILYRTEYSQLMIVFSVALAVSVITLICALFLVKRFPRLLLPVMYLLELSVLGTDFAISLAQPDQRTATMIALALLVPVCFIDRTIASIVLESAGIVVYSIIGRDALDPEIYSWGVKNLIIFSVAGIMSGHIVNKARFERYFYADSAKRLADLQATYNEELEREVAAKTERIVALHDQLVIGMATMVEGRDNSTGGHIKRTSEGVRILIEAIREDGTLQLTNKFCEDIIKAPMHDLGKISVDDAILRKLGRFTPDEYEVMKTHAAEGARILHEILADTDDEEFRRIAENVAH